ncbi:MAG TPA: DUF1631 domain-containing protein [Sedimenticola sp.]|nr:DUF1631 domain-containing protein [Sedimenticola sp.]
MSPSHNIISFGNAAREHRSVLDDKTLKAVSACRSVMVRTLPRLTDGLFEKLDDALYELADKSETGSVQEGYFDAMREVRKQRNRIQNDFIQGLKERFDGFWRFGPAANAEKPGAKPEAGFSLMEEDDLEESLAINDMVAKGENLHERELYAMEQRFVSMLKDEGVSHQSNPVAPAAICACFGNSLKGLEVEIPVKLVIYKLLDKQVLQHLGPLYREINATLEKAGVMPMLMPRTRQKAHAPAVRKETAGPLPEGRQGQDSQRRDTAGAAEDEAVSARIFSSLQQLLDLRRQQDGVSVPVAETMALPPVDQSELMGALSFMQKVNVELLSSAPALGAAMAADTDIKSALLSKLKIGQEGEEAKALGRADNDTIDVIAMLFEFILEDKNLPDVMRALLGRLQIPMLKVALLDKSFLSKKQHPARRLLNRLAQAAFAWSEGDGAAGDDLYEKMESVVKRILSEFDSDLALFEEIDQEFGAFLEKEQHRSEAAEHRIRQISRGKAQLKAARRQVAGEIEARLKGREVPKVVAVLLRHAWRDVLLLVNLRQGPESRAWTNALALMDEILWSVEPKFDQAERQRMLQRMPAILKELREGLTSISYDPCKMTKLFKYLQACHIAALRPAQSSGGESRAETPGPDAGTGGLEPAVEPAGDRGIEEIVLEGLEVVEEEGPEDDDAEAGVSDEYSAQVEALAVGTWLEIIGDNGTASRVKLSWKSVADGFLVFVNRRGIKMMEVSTGELAALLRAGNATVLSDLEVPLMDRALSSMMEALNNMEEQRPSKKA